MQTSRITWQMSEAQLQAAVVEAAGYLGWRHFHSLYSPGSDRGYPDLTLVNVRQQRVIWAELKGPRGIVSNAQREWLADLTSAGCEAYLWTPAEWHDGTIEAVLKGEQP